MRVRIERDYSLLRLRISSETTIRELHAYGKQLRISRNGRSPQHKGFGKRLLKMVEEISRDEFDLDRIRVIAAIGMRNYYRKTNYRLSGTYMVKLLK